MAKKIEELNGETPKWFVDWHNLYFNRVKTLAERNERLIYVILGAVLLFNTLGNYYHEEVMQFIVRLFS